MAVLEEAAAEAVALALAAAAVAVAVHRSPVEAVQEGAALPGALPEGLAVVAVAAAVAPLSVAVAVAPLSVAAAVAPLSVAAVVAPLSMAVAPLSVAVAPLSVAVAPLSVAVAPLSVVVAPLSVLVRLSPAAVAVVARTMSPAGTLEPKALWCAKRGSSGAVACYHDAVPMCYHSCSTDVLPLIQYR